MEMVKKIFIFKEKFLKNKKWDHKKNKICLKFHIILIKLLLKKLMYFFENLTGFLNPFELFKNYIPIRSYLDLYKIFPN